MAYLTKSRFKLALSCPTKLYYGTKGNNYHDAKADDPFMMALAEGGYQVGELAKFLISDDPVAEDISIDDLDYQIALDKTAQKRSMGGREWRLQKPHLPIKTCLLEQTFLLKKEIPLNYMK
jgi:hypothetical protein